MGSAPKMPPPPPPPPPPKDEADAVDTARLMQQRALGQLGYKKAFVSGARGPGGPTVEETTNALNAAEGRTPTAAPTRTAPPRVPAPSTRPPAIPIPDTSLPPKPRSTDPRDGGATGRGDNTTYRNRY